MHAAAHDEALDGSHGWRLSSNVNILLTHYTRVIDTNKEAQTRGCSFDVHSLQYAYTYKQHAEETLYALSTTGAGI